MHCDLFSTAFYRQGHWSHHNHQPLHQTGMTCKPQSWGREVDHWVWGKKQVGKKEELGFPGKQPRSCDMSSSASGADRGKEHMHITDLKKKCHSWKSELNLCPWAQLHLLIPTVLLDQSGRSQDTTEESSLHKPKFCAVSRESSGKMKNRRNNPYFTTTISVAFQEDYTQLSHH